MGSSNDTLVWYVNLFSWMVISHKGLNHFIWINFRKNSGAWYLARWQLRKSVVSLMRKEHERKLFVLSSFRNSKRILLLLRFNVGHTYNLWVSPLKPWNKLQCHKWGWCTQVSWFFLSVKRHNFCASKPLMIKSHKESCFVKTMCMYSNLKWLFYKLRDILLFNEIGI